MAGIETRLTRALDIAHPIVSAPMAFAAGGRLAAAVSRAGGLGLIGGGYGDEAWLKEQLQIANDEEVGVGFITWSLQSSPALLTLALERRPKAIMLSFGDPRPFEGEIRKAGAALICQCQTIDHVHRALDVGADVIVAQGTEAGGHGARRGTMSFVPEVADLIQECSSSSLLVAAGGIADGRGLAASLMLGADGVLLGTRFWAASEAMVHEKHRGAILAASGDDTTRTTVVDIVRNLAWPPEFTARVSRNRFVEHWHGRETLLQENVEIEGARYRKAWAEGDPEDAAVWFGEAAGLINRIEPAAEIIERMLRDADNLLRGSAGT